MTNTLLCLSLLQVTTCHSLYCGSFLWGRFRVIFLSSCCAILCWKRFRVVCERAAMLAEPVAQQAVLSEAALFWCFSFPAPSEAGRLDPDLGCIVTCSSPAGLARSKKVVYRRYREATPHKGFSPISPALWPVQLDWCGPVECISGGHGELFYPEKQHKLVCPRADVTLIMLPSAFNQDHGFLNIDFQSQEKKESGRRRMWGLRKAGESGASGSRALK